jgi:hypothetical protein
MTKNRLWKRMGLLGKRACRLENKIVTHYHYFLLVNVTRKYDYVLESIRNNIMSNGMVLLLWTFNA